MTVEKEGTKYIKTDLRGSQLLQSSHLNKGTAFSTKERQLFNLIGLLPHSVETLDEQLQRAYQQYSLQADDLQKNIFLNNLYHTNETLFFRLIREHIQEMMPIIYTPTAGLAIQHYSDEFRKPRGIYLSYPERDHINEILDHWDANDINLIVLTDSEQILGIGDQGANGIGISVAKLVVYTLCAGINPRRMLPIMIDVGTNNPQLLEDPFYLGWRHHRISSAEYHQFVETVINAIKEKFPQVFLQWEDFGKKNARCHLDRYQDSMCTFNDDIQGTGAVAMAALLNALKITGTPLSHHRVLVYGAGTAGCGIADQIWEQMIKEGLNHQKAYSRFYLMDRQGLVTSNRENIDYFKAPYARSSSETDEWDRADDPTRLLDVVRNIHPTILIGTSTVHGAFNREVVNTMAAHVERPIIFPLSNPLTLAEATPDDIIHWTQGRALVATGSPFSDVEFQGKFYPVSQCNNALIFPGLGLGIISCQAERVSAGMMDAATLELANSTTDKTRLLPEISQLQEVSKNIGVAVARQAILEGVALNRPDQNVENLVESNIWEPVYMPYQPLNIPAK
ncbi:NAD-dependent malic enzyme [Methanobacterium formicicum]|uniref:NAD-dependent malic enzyme n=1 Tax=Methanobacterium formicicum TaxID=2162 RepID=UPI00064E386D|nr:NAD-dependent malic enzyme [Methanobacterium formicicum]